MDGQQGKQQRNQPSKLTTSLQFRLGLTLAVAILITAAIGGTIGYNSAFQDANELLDDQLREVAAMIDSKRIELGQTDPITRVGIVDKETHVAIQVLDDANIKGEMSSEPGVVFPHAELQLGMQTVRAIGGKRWRVLVIPLKSGNRLAVGQRIALRKEIARHAAFRTVMPIVLLVPILIALMIVVLRFLLAPVTRLSREVDRRAHADVTALDARGLPSELTPFVASINDMPLGNYNKKSRGSSSG